MPSRSIREARNSGVSSAAAPLKNRYSLKLAVDVPLSRRPVVAQDVEHQRVVEDVERLERVDQAADVVVGVLEEPGVDLHLTGQHRLELVRHVLPCGDLGMPGGELRVGGHDAPTLLLGERPLAQRVPAVVEPPAVPVGPLQRHVVRGVGRPGREVHEERPVRAADCWRTHAIARSVMSSVKWYSSSALRSGSIGVVPSYRAGANWFVSPPRNPKKCSNPPPPVGHASNGPTGLVCHTGTSWHLPNWAVA